MSGYTTVSSVHAGGQVMHALCLHPCIMRQDSCPAVTSARHGPAARHMRLQLRAYPAGVVAPRGASSYPDRPWSPPIQPCPSHNFTCLPTHALTCSRPPIARLRLWMSGPASISYTVYRPSYHHVSNLTHDRRHCCSAAHKNVRRVCKRLRWLRFHIVLHVTPAPRPASGAGSGGCPDLFLTQHHNSDRLHHVAAPLRWGYALEASALS